MAKPDFPWSKAGNSQWRLLNKMQCRPARNKKKSRSRSVRLRSGEDIKWNIINQKLGWKVLGCGIDVFSLKPTMHFFSIRLWLFMCRMSTKCSERPKPDSFWQVESSRWEWTLKSRDDLYNSIKTECPKKSWTREVMIGQKAPKTGCSEKKLTVWAGRTNSNTESIMYFITIRVCDWWRWRSLQCQAVPHQIVRSKEWSPEIKGRSCISSVDFSRSGEGGSSPMTEAPLAISPTVLWHTYGCSSAAVRNRTFSINTSIHLALCLSEICLWEILSERRLRRECWCTGTISAAIHTYSSAKVFDYESACSPLKSFRSFGWVQNKRRTDPSRPNVKTAKTDIRIARRAEQSAHNARTFYGARGAAGPKPPPIAREGKVDSDWWKKVGQAVCLPMDEVWWNPKPHKGKDAHDSH